MGFLFFLLLLFLSFFAFLLVAQLHDSDDAAPRTRMTTLSLSFIPDSRKANKRGNAPPFLFLVCMSSAR